MLCQLSIDSSVPLQESKLKAARMHIYVRRGGPNYQTGLAKMRALGEELGVPIQVIMKICFGEFAFECFINLPSCLLLMGEIC